MPETKGFLSVQAGDAQKRFFAFLARKPLVLAQLRAAGFLIETCRLKERAATLTDLTRKWASTLGPDSADRHAARHMIRDRYELCPA